MIPIVVLTCEREAGFQYLERTVESIDAQSSGLQVDRFVVCDVTGGRAVAPPRTAWARIPFERPSGTLAGNKLPYWDALTVALGNGGGGAGALVFEDDIELCTGAVRRMVTFPVPDDCDFLMFFAPAVLQGKHSHPGLWRTPTPVLGTQAIKFSGRALRRLVEWRDSRDFQKFTASDQALELARLLLGMRYAAHCPELVQHVGSDSAASPGLELEGDRGMRWRRSVTYSPRLDAMALYARDDLYR